MKQLCVYTSAVGLPLSEVRQLYFKIKDRVLTKGRFGLAYSSQEMEKILKDVFGDMKMDQVHRPK